MTKSFSGQVVLCFGISGPYLLTLAKTDYPSILFQYMLIWRPASMFKLLNRVRAYSFSGV